MGVYIYEGHLGHLYTSEEALPFDALHCDQCGDSDQLLGYATNVQEAWEILKPKTDMFDDTLCVNCPHECDDDYCNEKCENYSAAGGYALSYVMGILHGAFPNDVKWHSVYLLIKCRQGDKEYYFARCDGYNAKFGDRQSLPAGVCFDAEYAERIARFLMIFGNDVDTSTFKHLTTKYTRDNIIHIYECEDNAPNGDDWCDVATYVGDGWYGYFDHDKLNLVEEQELIFSDVLFGNEEVKE